MADINGAFFEDKVDGYYYISGDLDLRWEAEESTSCDWIVDEYPDLVWEAEESTSCDWIVDEYPDLRWLSQLSESSSGGGGTTTTYYWLMRGLTDPGGTFVYWVSQNNPDYSGSSAPEPVVVASIVIVKELDQ